MKKILFIVLGCLVAPSVNATNYLCLSNKAAWGLWSAVTYPNKYPITVERIVYQDGKASLHLVLWNGDVWSGDGIRVSEDLQVQIPSHVIRIPWKELPNNVDQKPLKLLCLPLKNEL